MGLNEEVKRIKAMMFILNEDIKNEHVTCPKCDHSWDIEKSDEDPYLCHDCGYDQSTGEYEFDKLASWEKANSVNENDSDEYEDHYLFDVRSDLVELKKELIDSGVNENTRLHLTHDNDLKKMNTKQRDSGPKPMGLWYCVGFGWLDFTTSDFTTFYTIGNRVHAFEISLDGLNILKITSYDELLKFEDAYLVSNEEDVYKSMRKFDIDWARVAENYDGIEIAPYIHKARMGHMWYYGWDVASGCIWNTSNLKYKPILHK